MAGKKLYLEERIGIAYKMLNEDSIHLKNEKEWNNLVHQIMGVLLGYEWEVPERMKYLIHPPPKVD